MNSAAETNLLEQPSVNLSVENDTVRIQVKPYEIKTVKVHFAQAGNAKANATDRCSPTYVWLLQRWLVRGRARLKD